MGYARKKTGGQTIIMFTLFVGFLMGFSASPSTWLTP